MLIKELDRPPFANEAAVNAMSLAATKVMDELGNWDWYEVGVFNTFIPLPSTVSVKLNGADWFDLMTELAELFRTHGIKFATMSPDNGMFTISGIDW